MAKEPVAKDPKQGDLIDKIELTAPSDAAEIPTPPEPETPEVEEPEAEDASAALQKQIEALRKSEGIQKDRADRYRQEAEQHQRLANERGLEVEKSRKEKLEADLGTVSTALKAAQDAAEAAERDIRTAENNGDVDLKIDAFKRLTKAENAIYQYESGKLDIEEKIKSPPRTEQPVQQQQPVLPQRVQNWIAKNKDRIDEEIWNDMKAYHPKIIRAGYAFDSDEYLADMEVRLGWRERESKDEPVVQQPQQRTSIVSAPVSREAPSTPNNDRSSSQVKLTPAQREYAKIAGVSEKVYAEQLQKINKMKANGSYELKGG